MKKVSAEASWWRSAWCSALTPMAAFADDVPMTINIDVGG